MTRRAVSVVCAIAAIAVVAAVSPLESATAVTLRSADGVSISASWSAPPAQAPAVLLVHSLARTHADWDDAAQSLNSAGFGVLAVDLRGHGASAGPFATGSFQSMGLDVQAALAWLKGRHDVIGSRIGIAGMNLGATLAVIAAGGDSSVRSLALLSPAAEFRGLRCEPAMRAFAVRSGAAFLVAGALDPYASRSARQLGETTPGLREVRLIEASAANGRALFSAAPDLVGALVDWFRKTLL
jgi:alpha-beta hydrolase superfamily lysophospholipase